MRGKRAKKARRRGKIQAGNSIDAVASFTQNLRDAAVKEFGQDSCPELDDYWNVEGLSLRDNFALQYVLGVDVLVLGRLISVMGPAGEGKTQFCLWLGYQFMKFPGLVLYFDSEKKPSPSQFKSILQFPMERLKQQLTPYYMDDMQDMVDKLIWHGQIYVKSFPDKIIPMYVLVDSISGLAERKAREEAAKGEARDNNMEAAHNAKTLTKGIRTFTTEYLAKQPFFIAMITHQKKKIGGDNKPFGFGGGGDDMDTGTGGLHKDFQATWRLVIKTAKRHKSPLAEDTAGRVVEHTLQAEKCGMGEDFRKIRYDTHAYMDPETDQLRMDFDFDSALIRLLMDEYTTGKQFLKSKIGLVKKAANEFNVNSIGKKGLTMQQAGRAINESPELIKELQRYFRISTYSVFGQKKDHDPEVVDDDGFD